MYLVTIHNDYNDSVGTVIHSPRINQLKVESDSMKLGINSIDSFTFKIYPNNPGFNKINPLVTLIKVLDNRTNTTVFEGRVLAPISSLDEDGTVHQQFVCESELAYLHDSVQSFKKITGKATGIQLFKQAISIHNSQVEPYKRFTIGIIDIEDTTEYVRYIDDTADTYDTIMEKLISNENIGGELQIRKENGVRYLDWLKKIGYQSKTEIRLSKNLLSMSKELDPTEVITRLFPRGERLEAAQGNTDTSQPRLTISKVNNGLEYLDASKSLIDKFGIQGGVVTFDDVTKDTILKTKGIDFLNNQFVAVGSYVVKAVDLSLIGIDPETYIRGNIHRVINPLMATDDDLRLIQVNIKINNPSDSELTFGEKKMTMSQYQAETNRAKLQVKELGITVDNQRRQLGAVNEKISETQQQIIKLEKDVGNGATEIQNQIQVILENLQEIAKTVPSEETIQSIQSSITDLETFKLSQETINISQTASNLDFEKRIKLLEGKK